MNIKNDLTIRQLLAMDPSVEPERIDRAMRILNGLPPDLERLMHVVSFAEVKRRLHIGDSTLDALMRNGKLVKVTGLGNKGIGVTRDSLDALLSNDGDPQ